MTPFNAGRAAYQAGKTQDENPHDQKAPAKVYPGKWANWNAGHINAKATAEHTQRTKSC